MSLTAITTRIGKSQRLTAPARSPVAQVSVARMRLWTFLLLAAAGMLIVACVACFVFLRSQVSQVSQASTLTPTPRPEPEMRSPPVSNTSAVAPLAAAKSAPFPSAIAPPAPPPPMHPKLLPVLPLPSTAVAEKPKIHAPVAPAPIALQPKPAPAGDPKAVMQRDRVLETVGSLGAVQLYQNYLNVGLLADAVEHETYTKMEAVEVLNTISLLSEAARAQMEKLEAIDLDPEDVKALKQAHEVAKLLKSQADHLREHWASGEKAASDRYHEVRKQSWKELAKILGANP